MKILLDSSFWYTDFHLSGNQPQRLRTYVESGIVEVYVPELVIVEIGGKVEREAREQRKTLATFRRILSASDVEGIRAILDETERTAESIARKIAQDFPLKLAELPSIDNAALAVRAVKRVRPFNDKGSGYRDSLIWLTTLALADACTEGEAVVLITGDAAFYERDAPHADLVAELRDRNLEHRVSICRDLKTVLAGLPEPPELGAEEDVEERLDELFAGLEVDLSSRIEDRLSSLLESYSLTPRQAGLPRSSTDLFIQDFYPVDISVEFRNQPTSLMSPLYLEFAAEAIVRLEFRADLEDVEYLNLEPLESGYASRPLVEIEKSLTVSGSVIAHVSYWVNGEELERNQEIDDSMSEVVAEIEDTSIELDSVEPPEGDIGRWFWS